MLELTQHNMKVFRDYISGDEFLSDSFPYKFTMEDACIEAKAKYVTKGETVIDIQDKFGLSEVNGFSKAEFMSWARGYLPKITTRLQAENPERVLIFKRGATKLIKLIANKFAKMQLFVGKKMDQEGAFCFAY